MANLLRARCSWQGSGVVGGGVSTFYFQESATGVCADLVTFFTEVAGAWPASVEVVVPNGGETIDIATGQPNGTWTQTGGDTVVSSGGGDYASGVGARIKWVTNRYRNGRRVNGSTFIVPLNVASYDSDGTLDNAIAGAITTAADNLLDAQTPNLVVYSRPKGVVDGIESEVTSAVCPDKISWLRSRRV